MGNCALKMMAREATRDPPSSAEVQRLTIKMEQMCLRSETNEVRVV